LLQHKGLKSVHGLAQVLVLVLRGERGIEPLA
jgi:hypothetical protein